MMDSPFPSFGSQDHFSNMMNQAHSKAVEQLTNPNFAQGHNGQLPKFPQMPFPPNSKSHSSGDDEHDD